MEQQVTAAFLIGLGVTLLKHNQEFTEHGLQIYLRYFSALVDPELERGGVLFAGFLSCVVGAVVAAKSLGYL